MRWNGTEHADRAFALNEDLVMDTSEKLTAFTLPLPIYVN
jgi:hypothetical protein